MADSLCCTAKTNVSLESNYTPKKNNLERLQISYYKYVQRIKRKYNNESRNIDSRLKKKDILELKNNIVNEKSYL